MAKARAPRPGAYAYGLGPSAAHSGPSLWWPGTNRGRSARSQSRVEGREPRRLCSPFSARFDASQVLFSQWRYRSRRWPREAAPAAWIVPVGVSVKTVQQRAAPGAVPARRGRCGAATWRPSRLSRAPRGRDPRAAAHGLDEGDALRSSSCAQDGCLFDAQQPCDGQIPTNTDRVDLLFQRLAARPSRPAGRVLQRAVRRPGKRSVLLAHSRGCLHRQPERLMMIIASHRLASTWSRPSSTERRRRWWVTERALLKARLESGTEHELVRPSGHGAALAGPGGDRWAARSGAVPAAILDVIRP